MIVSIEPRSGFERTYVDVCRGCQIPLQGSVTGRHRAEDGNYCDDCYFEQLGVIVEAFPISTPSIHR